MSNIMINRTFHIFSTFQIWISPGWCSLEESDPRILNLFYKDIVDKDGKENMVPSTPEMRTALLLRVFSAHAFQNITYICVRTSCIMSPVCLYKDFAVCTCIWIVILGMLINSSTRCYPYGKLQCPLPGVMVVESLDRLGWMNCLSIILTTETDCSWM